MQKRVSKYSIDSLFNQVFAIIVKTVPSNVVVKSYEDWNLRTQESIQIQNISSLLTID